MSAQKAKNVTYSYALKQAGSKGKYYLYLHRVKDRKISSCYIGKVNDSDPRVRMILLKRENETDLKQLAEQDGIKYADKFN